MQIQGVSFMVTYACNLRCSHCFFDTQSSTARLSSAQVEAVLADPGRRYAWLHFTGGEPLLDPEALYVLVEAARRRHSGDIGIATNGYWGADPGRAREVARRLAEVGVNGVGLSVDAFHGVSIRAVREAALAVSEQGLARHSYLMACVVPGREEESLAPAERVSEATGIPVARVAVRRMGRAATSREEAGQSELPAGPCRELATCLGEAGPFDPRMVWVDPHGNVMICYGLAIGTLAASPFGSILEGYDPAAHPVLDRLARQGPRGLLELARERGVGPSRHSFADTCDLCYVCRKALRPLYADVLTPAECYP